MKRIYEMTDKELRQSVGANTRVMTNRLISISKWITFWSILLIIALIIFGFILINS